MSLTHETKESREYSERAVNRIHQVVVDLLDPSSEVYLGKLKDQHIHGIRKNLEEVEKALTRITDTADTNYDDIPF